MPVLILLYLVIPAIQIGFFLDPATSHLTAEFMPPVQELLNYFFAIFLYHAMLANVIVAARIPWLQRLIPQDYKIRFHIASTALIAIALIYHALFKIFDGKEIGAISWTLLVLFIVLVLASLLWTPVPGFQKLRKTLHTRFHKIAFLSYGLYKNFHNILMICLSLLMFVHIVQAEVVFQDNMISTVIYCGYLIAALGLFGYSKWRFFTSPKVRLTSLETQGEILTLRFQCNNKLLYRPGQFAYLRFPLKGFPQERHPFSFLSAPHEETLAFSIRSLGDFTRQIKKLHVGDLAQIDASYGAFYPSAQHKKLCFVSSGIGVVPFISILKDLDNRNDNRPVHFFVSVHDELEIPELSTLQSLMRKQANRSLFVLEQKKENQRYTAQLFQQTLKDIPNWNFFVCTSPKVFQSVFSALKNLKVPARKIISERFSFGTF